MNPSNIQLNIPESIKYADCKLHVKQTRKSTKLVFRDDIVVQILDNNDIPYHSFTDHDVAILKSVIVAKLYMEYLDDGGTRDKAGEVLLFNLTAYFGITPNTLPN